MSTPGGNLLRRFRESKGKKWTRQHLSETAGVTAAYIYALESGRKHNPSNTILESLAEALDLGGQASKALLRAFQGEGTIGYDLAAQYLAEEVWVISRIPIEGVKEAYFEFVTNKLARDYKEDSNKCIYTYWTSEPMNFDRLLTYFQSSPILNNTEKGIIPLEKVVNCIRTPEEADWFSLVIYEPRQEYAFGHITSWKSGKEIFRTWAIDSHTLDRVLLKLWLVYRALLTDSLPENEREQYSWHYPQSVNE